MQPTSDAGLLDILKDLHESNITLVEWETPLLHRLGCPLALKEDLLFLVPDEQLHLADSIVKARSLPVGHRSLSYLSEFANQGLRYVFDDPIRRLILVPLSWTGIKQEELTSIEPTGSMPLGTTLTVPLPSLCTAYLRIIMQEEAGSVVRVMAIADLSSVIAYSMFDMTYEGAFMSCPEDDMDEAGDIILTDAEKDKIAEEDALQRENALNSIREWHFGPDTEWARDTLIRLVSGTLQYDRLPGKGQE